MSEEKKHVNVGTIGHIDHGKTTLSASIGRGATYPKWLNDFYQDGEWPTFKLIELPAHLKPKCGKAAKVARTHHRPYGHRFSRGR